MSHGVSMTPGTDPNAVRAVGLPCALTPNRYSEVRHAAVRAAATNVRPSPVATPVSAVARNGSLIVVPRAPVLALTTTMDGCVVQFSATKKGRHSAVGPSAGPAGAGPRTACDPSSDTATATAVTAAAAATGISSLPRAGGAWSAARRSSPACRPRTPAASTGSGRTVSAAAR